MTKFCGKQTGVAFLLFILLVFVAAATVLVTKLNKSAGQFYWEDYTADRLSEARSALIARAASDENRPGSLPCPDTDGDGSSDGPVSTGGVCGNTIGFFPWRTLDVEQLQDGTGSPLLYAVQSSLRDHQSAEPINFVTPGQLSVDGVAGVVAVIFSPAEAVGNQDRLASPTTVSSYLEEGNADGDMNFVSVGSTTFNDQLNIITQQQLMTVVENTVSKRLLSDISSALSSYQSTNNQLPWLSPYSDLSYQGLTGTRKGHLPLDSLSLPTWITRNNWHQTIYVAYASGETPPGDPVISCSAGTDCLNLDYYSDTDPGGLPQQQFNDKRAIILFAGSALPGQDRSTGSINSYFEGHDASIAIKENADTDDNFETVTHSVDDFNDVVISATSCPPPDSNKLCWSQ